MLFIASPPSMTMVVDRAWRSAVAKNSARSSRSPPVQFLAAYEDHKQVFSPRTCDFNSEDSTLLDATHPPHLILAMSLL
jgi:hypothetical protein